MNEKTETCRNLGVIDIFVTLSFVLGYVAVKENFPEEAGPGSSESSEFMEMVSRGKLAYPPEWLFQFSRLCYASFTLHSPSCASRVQQLFLAIAEYFFPGHEFPATAVSRRLSNCFFKGLVQRYKTKDASPDVCDRKLKKLRSSTVSK